MVPNLTQPQERARAKHPYINQNKHGHMSFINNVDLKKHALSIVHEVWEMRDQKSIVPISAKVSNPCTA